MAEMTTHRLSIGGMSCAGCVAAVEKALRKVPGVVEASVNFAEHTAQVEGEVAADILIHAVVDAGYNAAELASAGDEQAERAAREMAEYRALLKKSALAALVGVPLLLGGWLGGLPPLTTDNGQVFWLAAGIATFMVLSYAGRQYFVGAWRQFKHHRANMDALIAMGTGVAWCYSMAIVFAPRTVPTLAPHAYFDAAAVIIALVNFGSALEMRARGKTAAGINHLIGLQRQTARVVRDGRELDVAVAEVGLGDTLRVGPGECLPVDGIVIDGRADVDESMIGGEPPATKQAGDEVMGGTLNTAGTLLYQARRIGQDTVLARIIARVRSAQAGKPPIGRFADRAAAVFVPGVLVIAVITFLLWFDLGPAPGGAYAIVAAMAVLIIASPSALGLATPISFMVGIGKAAEHGVLIHNGEALQRAGQVTTVVLGKSGTVTEGRPRVTTVVPRGWLDGDQLLEIAAAVEAASEHPLASAVVAAAAEKGLGRLEMSGFEAASGRGVLAWMNQQRILLGNRRWMEDNHVDIGELARQAEQLAANGQIPLYLALNRMGAGVIAISDPIRRDAPTAVARLHAAGLKVAMLTGDDRVSAEAVARQVGIDTVIAEVLPQDKTKKVAELQAHGEIVAMAGDAIDDAQALARSDIGFAVGGGADAAAERADITLLRGSLHGVADAIVISRATVRNIKQNLFGAMVYNSLGIPLAAGALYALTGVLLNPMIAGAAMALSSLAVVGNARRLRRLRLPERA